MASQVKNGSNQNNEEVYSNSNIHNNPHINIKDMYKNSRNRNLPMSMNLKDSTKTKTVNFFKSHHHNSKVESGHNSVFADFRKELEKSKEIVNLEIEKSKKIREKYLILKSNKKDAQLKSRDKNEKLWKNEYKIEIDKKTSNIFKTGINFNSQVLSPASPEMPKIRNPKSTNNAPLISITVENSNLYNNFQRITLPIRKKTEKIVRQSEKIINPSTSHSLKFINDLKDNPGFNPKINSQINSNIFNSPNESYYKDRKPSGRLKLFKISFDPLWYDKEGFPEPKFNQQVVCNLDFQSSIIGDNVKVILENIQFYKMSYLNNSGLLQVFQAIDKKKQGRMNGLLEETCGLMLEISNNILVDFSQYLEKFVSVQPPRPEKLISKIVKNEEKAFHINVNLFNEITAFLKSCYEVYSTLVKQVDDMVIPFKDFVKINQYLSRIRLNLSDLIFSAKNYIKNYKFDLNLIEKYKVNFGKNVIKDDDDEDQQDRNGGKSIGKASVARKDLGDKIKNQYSFKKNEYNERNRRLNAVLNRKENEMESSFEKKKKKLGKGLVRTDALNCDVIDKLLKYFPKDIKNLIISERIINRHKERTGDTE